MGHGTSTCVACGYALLYYCWEKEPPVVYRRCGKCGGLLEVKMAADSPPKPKPADVIDLVAERQRRREGQAITAN